MTPTYTGPKKATNSVTIKRPIGYYYSPQEGKLDEDSAKKSRTHTEEDHEMQGTERNKDTEDLGISGLGLYTSPGV